MMKRLKKGKMVLAYAPKYRLKNSNAQGCSELVEEREKERGM